MHQACPHRHRLDGRREVEDARDGGGDILADAVSRQCCRANTVGLDQLRQRIFHREQRRLGPVGALQVSCGPVEYLRAQVDTQFLTEPCGALIEMLGKHRLGLIEATRHPDVLSALARKQENDSLRIIGARNGFADEHVVVLFRGQHRCRVLPVVDDRRHAEVFFPAACEGVGDIGQGDLVWAGQFGGQR